MWEKSNEDLVLSRWLVILTSEPDTDHLVAALARSVTRGQVIHIEIRGAATQVMKARLQILQSLGSVSISESRFPPPSDSVCRKLLRILHRRAHLRRWLEREGFSLVIQEWWDGIAGPPKSVVLRLRNRFLLDFSTQIQFAARDLGIPIVALPHGHALLTSELAFPGNHALDVASQNRGRLPFSNRNSFAAYVVAHQIDKQFIVNRTQMSGHNVVVWGSARFSPEWIHILYRETRQSDVFRKHGLQKTTFFLPKWNSRIDRRRTIDLLELLSRSEKLDFVIAEHPRRGASTLTRDERDRLLGATILAPGSDSVSLIKASDCVIEISSSICIDVVLTSKHLVMPRYLQADEAKTRLDQSTVISRTYDANSTLEAVLQRVSAQPDEFFVEHIAAQQDSDTLRRFDDGLLAIAAGR